MLHVDAFEVTQRAQKFLCGYRGTLIEKNDISFLDAGLSYTKELVPGEAS